MRGAAGDDVDRATRLAAPVKYRCGALQHLDLCDVGEIADRLGEILRRAEQDAVDRIGVHLEPAHHEQLGTVALRAALLNVRDVGDRIAEPRDLLFVDHFARDHLDRLRDILDPGLRAGGPGRLLGTDAVAAPGDEDLVEQRSVLPRDGHGGERSKETGGEQRMTDVHQ